MRNFVFFLFSFASEIGTYTRRSGMCSSTLHVYCLVWAAERMANNTQTKLPENNIDAQHLLCRNDSAIYFFVCFASHFSIKSFVENKHICRRIKIVVGSSAYARGRHRIHKSRALAFAITTRRSIAAMPSKQIANRKIITVPRFHTHANEK